ncbi:MAG: AAA family ATPase [Spirochaetaceae bacterium]|nr:MAG: AAA family ATPase [Spirochaetaceae bacterium]
MASPIVFISPSRALQRSFSRVSEELGKNIPVLIGELAAGARLAAELEEQGVDVIISRGGTSAAICRTVTEIPIIDIRVAGFDVLLALKKASRSSRRLVVAGCAVFTQGIEEVEDLLGVSLRVITVDENSDAAAESLRGQLSAATKEGFSWVVGDTFAVRAAQGFGLNATLIQSGRESLMNAILEAEKVASVRRQEFERSERLHCITNHAHEGIVSVGCDGNIDLINPSAERILAVRAPHILGQSLSRIVQDEQILGQIRKGYKQLGTIVSYGDVKIAANIVPVTPDGCPGRVIMTFQETSRIESVERKLRQELSAKGLTATRSFEDLVGDSAILADLKIEASEYAQVSSPILLSGETGVGKEIFAQAIHNASPRRDRPFVAINCAELPEHLLESELFGYVEGAFTGALRKGKQGLVALAHGGTVFFDEIGEISHSIQLRLLRFIQEKQIRRIGDDKLIPVDIRVVAATNQTLGRLVQEGTFREDLFYRLNVLNLSIPPLRSRPEDIPGLVEHFIQTSNRRLDRNVCAVSQQAMQMLRRYPWPGNARQLENIVERLVIRARTETIAAALVEAVLESESSHAPGGNGLGSRGTVGSGDTLKEIELSVIDRVLTEEDGNLSRAATRLGIGRTTLWRRMRDTRVQQ